MMDKANKTVILARVSSKAQEDEGYSLDSQVKLLTGYCKTNDLRVVKVFKISETASKQQSRKVFQELLKYLVKNKVHHLAVEKTDRLTRNMKDAVAINEWLEGDGKRHLHAVKENIRLHKDSKSDVKFMWNIHLAVAKKYSDNLREEAMKGWAEKLAQGWLPAPPPPGYKTITRNGKRVHVPDKQTAPIMIQAFSFYLQPEGTLQSTTDLVEKLGLTTRRGRPHSKSRIHAILANPFYIGINRFDGSDYPGAQEPLISKEVFSKVQTKMTRKTKIGRYRSHNPVFKSIIKCADCQGTVTWQLQKKKFYGACQRRQEECKGRSLLREKDIELVVEEKLQELVCPSKSVIDWVVAEMKAQGAENANKLEASKTMLEEKIKRIERMLGNLYDDKLAGEISEDLYKTKKAQLDLQRLNLKSELNNVQSNTELVLQHKIALLELSQKASFIYRFKEPESKRLIITKLFKNLLYENGSISVNYTKFAKSIAKNVQNTTLLMKGAK